MTTAEIRAKDDEELLSIYSHNSGQWWWTQDKLREQAWIRAELLRRMKPQ
jgi:hypothetical protein